MFLVAASGWFRMLPPGKAGRLSVGAPGKSATTQADAKSV